jgi:Putative Flp pilus-assembly TadE/G-like
MLRETLRKTHATERGQMAFSMILTLGVLFLFFALAFDAGLWYFDHRAAQNEADAAALAGALALPDTAAAAATAQTWMTRNGGGADINTCPTVTASSVTVCVKRSVPGVFALLSGIISVAISARATAVRLSQSVPYSLMAMNRTDCDTFTISGNAAISITGTNANGNPTAAGTYTRASCASSTGAIDVQGNNASLIATGSNDVVGAGNSRCTSGGQCTPPAAPGAQVLDDPFAGVPVPPIGSCIPGTSPSFSGGSNALSQGCYKGLSVSGGTLTLGGGVYVMEGPVSFAGTATITSNGAQLMFYMTCSTGPCPTSGLIQAGTFSTSGQANVNLKGMSQYQNLTIFVDRNSAHDTTAVSLTGKGSQTYTGAVYAINSSVTIQGNGGTLNLNVAVVADKLAFGGNAAVNITYNISLIPPIFRQLALTD